MAEQDLDDSIQSVTNELKNPTGKGRTDQTHHGGGGT